MEYKCVSTHPEDLASGRVVAPGETFDLDDEAEQHDHNKSLIENERILALPRERKRKTSTDKEGDDR